MMHKFWFQANAICASRVSLRTHSIAIAMAENSLYDDWAEEETRWMSLQEATELQLFLVTRL